MCHCIGHCGALTCAVVTSGDGRAMRAVSQANAKRTNATNTVMFRCFTGKPSTRHESRREAPLNQARKTRLDETQHVYGVGLGQSIGDRPKNVGQVWIFALATTELETTQPTVFFIVSLCNLQLDLSQEERLRFTKQTSLDRIQHVFGVGWGQITWKMRARCGAAHCPTPNLKQHNQHYLFHCSNT